MKILMIGLLLLLGALSESASAGVQDYIFGGVSVDLSDPVAASTVLITGHKSLISNYLCTGSIIAEDIVVTAAHCVVGTKPENLRVIFAQDVKFNPLTFAPEMSQSDPRMHQVYGAIANPDFHQTGIDQNDIAVIRIKGALPSGYSPARIIDPSAVLAVGEEAVLAGYGDTNPYVEGGSGGQLRKATVKIQQMLGTSEAVLDQTAGQGSCWGDSGGPAFAQSGSELLLWGLTDRAYPDSVTTCNHSVVYTRITSFSDFISQSEETLRQQQ